MDKQNDRFDKYMEDRFAMKEMKPSDKIWFELQSKMQRRNKKRMYIIMIVVTVCFIGSYMIIAHTLHQNEAIVPVPNTSMPLQNSAVNEEHVVKDHIPIHPVKNNIPHSGQPDIPITAPVASDSVQMVLHNTSKDTISSVTYKKEEPPQTETRMKQKTDTIIRVDTLHVNTKKKKQVVKLR